MDNYLDSFAQPEQKNERSENVGLGVIGALLFALAGGAVYVLLDRIGFIAGISGLVGVFCAVKGYSLFSGKESKKGIIIAVICAIIVLILAWYVCLTLDLMKAFKEEGLKLSFFEAFKIAYKALSIKSVAGGYIVNLVIGLGLAVVGSIGFISNYSKGLKAKQEQAVAPQYPEVNNAQPNYEANNAQPNYEANNSQPNYEADYDQPNYEADNDKQDFYQQNDDDQNNGY